MKKQRSFTFVMAIVVAVLLNGCAKHPGFLKNPKAPNRKDTGLVVSSYSSPRNNIAYGGMRNHIITYISLYAPHENQPNDPPQPPRLPPHRPPLLQPQKPHHGHPGKNINDAPAI